MISILTHGSETWILDKQTIRVINGANASMVSVITGRTAHEEVGRSATEEVEATEKTFDLILWIRARRLQWLGHILRMGTYRYVKQAIFGMYKDRREGDILMDAPKNVSWRELQQLVTKREGWRERVRS